MVTAMSRPVTMSSRVTYATSKLCIIELIAVEPPPRSVAGAGAVYAGAPSHCTSACNRLKTKSRVTAGKVAKDFRSARMARSSDVWNHSQNLTVSRRDSQLCPSPMSVVDLRKTAYVRPTIGHASGPRAWCTFAVSREAASPVLPKSTPSSASDAATDCTDATTGSRAGSVSREAKGMERATASASTT
eukprot:scaffold21964_cov118-Isochrysis_galbana.AAC.4